MDKNVNDLEYEETIENIRNAAKRKSLEREFEASHKDYIKPEDIEKNTFISLFAYLGIFILIPIFKSKDSKYVRFHISQGVNLIILELFLVVIESVVFTLLSTLGSIAIIATIVELFTLIFICILTIIGVTNAIKGRAEYLPLFGLSIFQ